MIVYTCLCNWDYEGSTLDGVYLSLKEARKHQFSGGDSCDIQKWSCNSKGIGRYISNVEFIKKTVRKGKK